LPCYYKKVIPSFYVIPIHGLILHKSFTDLIWVYSLSMSITVFSVIFCIILSFWQEVYLYFNPYMIKKGVTCCSFQLISFSYLMVHFLLPVFV
jgi:hypothetical protein